VKTYLIVPDQHIPYHCQYFLKITYKLLKATRFDGIVQLGDALDFWQLSTYDKDPSRKATIGDDISLWNDILTKWSSLLPRGAEVHLIEGNHEFRLHRYIARHARELYEIVRPLPDLLNLKARTKAGHVLFKWHSYSKWNSCRLGDCTLFHGFYFNQHTAATNLAKYRCNTISGHTHRVQYVSDGKHYAVSLGHGSDESQTAHQPTPTGWQQALAVLTLDDQGKSSVEIIQVSNGKAVWRGKVYSA
jgi:UDP-2,3-diacylglucosamine pyrophosphatase LpxH